MKTVFFEISKEEEPTLAKLLADLGITDCEFYPETLEQNLEVAKNAESISIFIHSKADQASLEKLPNLKLVTTRSTGFDHIDLNYCRGKNIAVCNVPAYGSRTVAEFTFSLILGLSRKSFLAYKQVKNNHDFNISHFEGFDLYQKTLGVIGTGKIGLNVISIAKGFGMKVLAFDTFPNVQKAQELNFQYASLNEVLKNSNVLTLHVPLNNDTKHLINSENIKQVKPGSILVNTSRGEVVETSALLWAVKEKVLSGVGLDVLEGEKDLADECALVSKENPSCVIDFKTLLLDHMLMDADEVAITPHIAFFTKEAKHEILRVTCKNIQNFYKGKIQNQI
jgi:D-lactate dehydrogenase